MEDMAMRFPGFEKSRVFKRILSIERFLLLKRAPPFADDIVERTDQRRRTIFGPGGIAMVGGLGDIDDSTAIFGEGNHISVHKEENPGKHHRVQQPGIRTVRIIGDGLDPDLGQGFAADGDRIDPDIVEEPLAFFPA